MMEDGATQGMRSRILRGVGVGSLAQLLHLLGRLLLVPLFLSAWGAAPYGEWLILSSLAAWLAVSDLGGQVYFVNRMTVAWTTGDKKSFERFLATGLAVFLAIPATLLLLLALFAYAVPFASWLKLASTTPGMAQAVLILLALQVCVSLPQGLLIGVYRATGALPRGVMLTNAMLLGQIALSAAVLISEEGMVAMALVQSLPAVAIALWAVRDLSYRLPGVRILHLGLADWAIAKEALHPSLHFFGIQMAQALSIQGSILAIGATLGAVEVAVFSTLRTLINIAKQLLGLFAHSAWPEFTRLDAAGEREQLRRLFVALMRGTLLFTLLFVLGLVVAGQWLFDFWLGGRLPFDAAAMRAFSLYTLLTVYWTLGANLLMAVNRHVALARWQICASAAGSAMCDWGAVQAGSAGAVYGLVSGEAVLMTAGVALLLGKHYPGFATGFVQSERSQKLKSSRT